MVFKCSESLQTITSGLGWVVSTCELQGLLKLFNDHVQAQHFFCRLLNAICQLQLQQMDQIQANYPAIDLGDAGNRIAYQITTEKGGDKVQHTLNKFVEHELDKTYDTLKMLVIGDRQESYKKVKVPPGLQFDCDCDILSVPELVKHLDTLPSPRLEAVEAIMREDLSASPVPRKTQRDELVEWLHQNAFRESLSCVLQQVLRLAQIVGNTSVERWARLELFGYNKEGGMLETDIVPEYRTIVGQYIDRCNRRLQVPPNWHFVNCDRLRFGAATLEELPKQNEMQNIADLGFIDLLRRELKVEVERFCFSPIAVVNVINAIRSQAMDQIRELER